MGDVYFFIQFHPSYFPTASLFPRTIFPIAEAKLYASSTTSFLTRDSLNFTYPEPFAIRQMEDICGSEFHKRKKKEIDNVPHRSVAVTPKGMQTRS